MKEFFYFIASFFITLILISSMVFLFTEKTKYEFPKGTTGLVIDKSENDFLGDRVYILTPDTTVGVFTCYDILFDKVEVGDSIVNGEILRNENSKDN